ncbi:MAG: MerR family transcriptional regulator, partial [Clostridia bacterium]|nr:MerR family transcriptional regulator [Clostridia bacterium]
MEKDRDGMRVYRIGEYAKKMGVTPDLLKHYEKMGLIESRASENKYRYYPFTESVRLLECFSLRNLDLPLQEIRHLTKEADAAELRHALHGQ